MARELPDFAYFWKSTYAFEKIPSLFKPKREGHRDSGAWEKEDRSRTLTLSTKSISMLSAPPTSPHSHCKSMGRWRACSGGQRPITLLLIWGRISHWTWSSDSARPGFLTFVPSPLCPYPSLPPSPPGSHTLGVPGMSCHNQLYVDAVNLSSGSRMCTESTWPTEPPADPTTEKCFNPIFLWKRTKDSETMSWPRWQS